MKAQATKLGKTSTVLIDTLAKLIVLYPAVKYAERADKVVYYIVIAAAAWLAATALLVVGKIVLSGIKQMHAEVK